MCTYLKIPWRRDKLPTPVFTGFPGGSDGKESAWVRKIPWRMEWLPSPVFLPGEFHGQSSLVGYSPWGCKELDVTEHSSFQFSSVAQLCPTLCNPMDCSPAGSSVHEIFQARILEWVAISFSRGSSQPRDRTWVSCTAGRSFTD